VNDLPWIKYDASRMYLDMIGMSRDTKVAHIALFNYTIINDGPPLNEDAVLRDITGISTGDWAATKGGLLQKGWIESGKFFLHRGTIKSLNESKAAVVENHNRTALAGNRPRMETYIVDAETGVLGIRSTVTSPVTAIVTACVAHTVAKVYSETDGQTEEHTEEHGEIQGQSEKQSESIPIIPKISGKGVPGEKPTANPPRHLGAYGSESRGRREESRPPGTLTEGNLLATARDTLARAEKDGTFYDNCRVKASMFSIGSFVSVLREFVGRVPAADVFKAFKAAVGTTHSRCIDGETNAKLDPVKNPGALVITVLRQQLSDAARRLERAEPSA
jgi:hypothetical protein